MALELLLLVVLPLVGGGVMLFVDLGPVIWIMAPGRGFHASDLVVLAVAGPLWLWLVWDLRRRSLARFRAVPASTAERNADGVPAGGAVTRQR